MSQQQPQPLPSPYAFMAYPAGAAAVGTAEYAFSPGGNPYPPPPEHAPSSSAGSIPPPPPPPPYLHYAAYAHHHAHHHMGHHGHHPPLPPSPIITGAHLPPSPVMHHSQHQPQHPHPHPHPHQYPNQQSTTPPTSPDRNAESKVMRQLCTAIAKMQSTMKDLAERQEQILDRMSVLEQRIGRADDGIERILENTEIAMEDSKSIRNHVEGNESQGAFEARMTEMVDEMVGKLVGGIGAEIKRMVKDAERVHRGHHRHDVGDYHRSPYELARRITDADLLGQEEQKEVPDI